MGRRALGLAALLVLVACLVSCGLLVSFDEFDTSTPGGASSGGGPTFEVRGVIDGLGTAKANLLLNGNESGVIEAGDGEFRFRERIVEGAAYGVTLREDVPGHPCTFERASGIVSGRDVTDIAIHCPVSHDANLVDLKVSAGDLSPTFDSKRDGYTTSPVGVPRLFPPPPMTVVDAKASEAGATITIGGAIAVGTASASLPLVDGPNRIEVLVTAADGLTKRRYAVDFSGHPSIDYVKASNTKPGAAFGTAIAMSGDTLVVGSPAEKSLTKGVNGDPGPYSPAAYIGAVYVYTRTPQGAWSQQAYLKASNARDDGQNVADANFGSSVAISADTLLVGAPFERSNATGVGGDQANGLAPGAGAAYVFKRTGTTWKQEAYVKASNTAQFSNFGYSVAIDGETMAVGASYEGSNDSGAAYVFTRAGAKWSQQAYLKASNPTMTALFGWSVALSGNTLAVGAPLEDGNAIGVNGDQTPTVLGESSGAAYVFTRTGATWSQQAYVKASNTRKGAEFGKSVALSKDTLAVGSDRESSGVSTLPLDESAGSAGAVYVFARVAAAWTQQAYVKPTTPRSIALFGAAVALEGDTLAVGSSGERSNATGFDGDQGDQSAANSGAAFVFRRTGTAWSQHSYLKATNTRDGAQFGWCVALSTNTVVVGSRGESSKAVGVNGLASDESAIGAGAAYVYR